MAIFQGIGIRYMNRFMLVLVLFFVSSCQYISYNQVIPLARQAIIGFPDIELTEEYIAKQRYSFARLDLGKGANIIMVLSDIDNNFYTWISATGEKLITYNGKIVKTIGLIHNIEIYNSTTFKVFSPKNNYSGIYNVMLKDPTAFIEQKFYTQLIQKTDSLELIESIEIDVLNLKYSNSYVIDFKSGRTIKSTQRIHPKLPEIKIDFIYK